MKKTVFVLAAAMLLPWPAPPAEATDYLWQTDNGVWTDPANWSPNLPAAGTFPAGSRAIVGDGVNPILCRAVGTLTAIPDEFIVRNAASVRPYDFLTGGAPLFIIESGGTLLADDYNTKHWSVLLKDGSTIVAGELAGDTAVDRYTISGTVKLDDGNVAVGKGHRLLGVFDGSGTLNVYGETDPAKNVLEVKAFQHTGLTHIHEGRLAIYRHGSEATQFGTADIIMEAGTEMAIQERYATVLNPEATLWLKGTGSDAAKILFQSWLATGNVNTVYGAIFGNTPVPAGTYIIGTDYTDYLGILAGATSTPKLVVLNTVDPPGGGVAEIPEPASAALLALGGLIVARRRRPPSR